MRLVSRGIKPSDKRANTANRSDHGIWIGLLTQKFITVFA